MKPAKPINRELKTVTPRHETGPTTDPLSTDGEFEMTILLGGGEMNIIL